MFFLTLRIWFPVKTERQSRYNDSSSTDQDALKVISDMAKQAQRESGEQERSAKIRQLKDLYDIVRTIPEHSVKKVRYEKLIADLESDIGVWSVSDRIYSSLKYLRINLTFFYLFYRYFGLHTPSSSILSTSLSRNIDIGFVLVFVAVSVEQSLCVCTWGKHGSESRDDSPSSSICLWTDNKYYITTWYPSSTSPLLSEAPSIPLPRQCIHYAAW